MNSSRLHSQRGTALVIAMLFLVILGMLGMTTMTATTLEERMAGNARDRDIAIQAAEAALRDAERDLVNDNLAYRVISIPTGFVAGCALALCTEGAALTSLDDTAKSAFLGQFTIETPVQGPVQQPRYIIELLTAIPPGSPPPGKAWRNFRVSAKGWGRSANTIVVLQTVYQVTY